MEEEEKTYIRHCDEQVQRRRGGQTAEGLIKRKMSLFNLETLPAAKRARLWIAAWLVLWSGPSRFIFPARSSFSPCVGCKVDYSLEGRRGGVAKKRNHAAEAPTTGSNHPASTAALTASSNAWHMMETLHFKPDYAVFLTPRCRIVMAWNCWLCQRAHARMRSLRLFVLGELRGWRVLKWKGSVLWKIEARLAWCNQPRVNLQEMMAIKQNGNVVSLPSFFFPPLSRKLTSGFKTICSLLWAYSSSSIILCNHQRLYFTIIWSDVSKLPLWRERYAQCAPSRDRSKMCASGRQATLTQINFNLLCSC